MLASLLLFKPSNRLSHSFFYSLLSSPLSCLLTKRKLYTINTARDTINIAANTLAKDVAKEVNTNSFRLSREQSESWMKH